MASFATMTLEKLPILSVDLETTGLKPAQDRVLQIGMLDPFEPQSAQQYFVKADIAIPASSTEIHGISEDDIKDAAPFPQAFRPCRDAMVEKVIIGYNIGFDLAILSAETERHGIEWQWNSALCLRQLATIALGQDAMLMMGDLDTLCAHYHIDTKGRHSALGDAEISAKLFYAMLDDLHAKSITTYGEARRAVSQLDQQRLATARAGWIDVAAPQQASFTSTSLARIDPYPYRHRISDIMMKDPLILAPSCTLHEAAIALRDARLDCAFVGSGAQDVEGIISERDIVRAISQPLDEVETARHIPLSHIMSSPVISVNSSDYMHVALGRIARFDIRHLGVCDEKGVLVGWLSTRELIRQRVSDAIILSDEIEEAQTSKDIARALANLPNLAASLWSENVRAADIAAVISAEYRNALAKSTLLAEAELVEERGPAPRSYAVLMLGSGGRDESLLAADQDHAIIYDDKTQAIRAEEADEIQAWFEALGKRISDILAQSGIPYCQGGVMSSSPKWCKTLTQWRKTIGDWCRKAGPEDLLSADIFFDFTRVHGEERLAWQLQQAMAGRAARHPRFLKSIAQSVSSHHGGTGFFGQLKTVNGRYQIKLHLLLPLIETLRVLSVSRGLNARNSYERAKALFETQTVPAEVLQISEDIHICMRFVLRQQIHDIADGLPPITDIEIDGLSKADQKLLKAIAGRIGRLDQLLQDTLF